MQGGGLIYVAIIALWAIVLVPMWLRRHDQASEMRGVDRFNNAMRSLRRRHAHALEPSRSKNVGVAMTKTASRSMTFDYSRQASTRRAIVLGVLTLALAATLIAGLASLVPMWAAIIPALLLGAFITASALTASHRVPDMRESSTRERRPTRQRRADEQPMRDERPVRATSRSAAVEEYARYLDEFDDDESWDAVPTTLPTYVTAPRATAVPRDIDRATPGEWTGAAMVERARELQSDRAVEFEDEIDRTAEIPLPRVAGQ